MKGLLNFSLKSFYSRCLNALKPISKDFRNILKEELYKKVAKIIISILIAGALSLIENFNPKLINFLVHAILPTMLL